MTKRLSHPMELYQKKLVPDPRGGRKVEWISLGTVWAHGRLCSVPFREDDHLKRIAHEITFRWDPRLLLTDKIIWDQRDHFPLHSPKEGKPGYAKIRVFSWEPSL